MIKRVHHLTFVVSDLARAASRWEKDLGISPGSREELPERGAICVRFQLGDLWIVLVEPVGDGVPAMRLREHGEGLLLVSLEVNDIATSMTELSARGVQAHGPLRRGVGGWLLQDLETDLMPGAITQLCQVAMAEIDPHGS